MVGFIDVDLKVVVVVVVVVVVQIDSWKFDYYRVVMMMMTMILMRACGAFVCFLNGSLVLGQIRASVPVVNLSVLVDFFPIGG